MMEKTGLNWVFTGYKHHNVCFHMYNMWLNYDEYLMIIEPSYEKP